MKTNFALLGALMMTAGLTVQVAQAQVSFDEIRATIPFDFQLGNRTLPAGRYAISESKGVLHVNPQMDHVKAASIVTIDRLAASAGKGNAGLQFKHYGDVYFLSGVWNEEGRGWSLQPSPQERKLALGGRGELTRVAAVKR